jgi:hypothetical protein
MHTQCNNCGLLNLFSVGYQFMSMNFELFYEEH